MQLIVAWDGASFDLIDTFVERGTMPTLASLLPGCERRVVRSTVPPVTFPAWTSFATAASPARHGVTDFTLREGYRVRFLNASYRCIPAFWEVLSRHGLRTGVYALPATYPATEFNGLLVCGFDTPFGASRHRRGVHPPGLAAEIERRHGSLAVEGPQQARIESGWHERVCEMLPAQIRLRTRIVRDLLARDRFDCFLVHFQESDTVAHHFWQFFDKNSPRYRPDGPASAIEKVYAALDEALAELLMVLGDDDELVIVSDHGSGGASDRAIAWNAWLAEAGYLRFGKSPLRGGGGLVRRAAVRALPPRWQGVLFRAAGGAAARIESHARFENIDWSRSWAFSEELNYFPAIWLNVKGREPHGIVEPRELDALLSRLQCDLEAMRDPFDGQPVVTRVMRREELADGPYAGRIPDLVLELRTPNGYSYCALPSRGGREVSPMRLLREEECTGARGTTMSGAHRPHGIWLARARDLVPERAPPFTLADAGATILHRHGCAPAPGADGRPWRGASPVARFARDGRGEENPGTSVATTSYVYGEAEERAVAERLRALGYLR